MKCRNLFSWKIRKNVSNLSSAELARRVVKVNMVNTKQVQISTSLCAMVLISDKYEKFETKPVT